MVVPMHEEHANEDDGKVDIYNVNTVEEETLSSIFGIKSIPTFLIIPVDGAPQIAQGAMSKAQFEKMFKDVFKV